jgi:hypothetical protein
VVQKTGDVAKARKEALPDWIDVLWFRRTFVTTYMAFVGQTANPWDVPITQAVEVMQKIWDATNDHEYEITAASVVWQKVCDEFCAIRNNFNVYVSDCPTPC